MLTTLDRKLHATQTIGDLQEIQRFHKSVKGVGVAGQVRNRPDIDIHLKAVNATQIKGAAWLIHLRAVERKAVRKQGPHGRLGRQTKIHSGGGISIKVLERHILGKITGVLCVKNGISIGSYKRASNNIPLRSRNVEARAP